MKLLTLLLLTLSTSAWAGVADVDNSDIKISPARIEQSQGFRDGDFALTLTRVDNGGSTDISSVINPSTLILGVFLQGEMFDVDLNFELYDNVVSLDSATYDPSNKTIRAVVTLINESMEKYPMNLTIFLEDALLAAAGAKEDSYETLATTVGLQAYRP